MSTQLILYPQNYDGTYNSTSYTINAQFIVDGGWISANLAVEANPIMNYFMGYSLEIFAIVKLIFMFSGIIILNYLKDKRSRLVFGVSFLLVFIYWIIGTWHLYGVMRLLL